MNLTTIMSHMDQFPFCHVNNAELNILHDQQSKKKSKVKPNGVITFDPAEVFVRGDSPSSDILCSNDPDMNCLSDMKQTLMSDCSYLMEEDFKLVVSV